MMPMTMTMRRPDELAQVQVAHSRGHHVTSRRYVLVSSGIVEVRQGERVASCCGLPSKETWPWPWSAPSGPEQLADAVPCPGVPRVRCETGVEDRAGEAILEHRTVSNHAHHTCDVGHCAEPAAVLWLGF
jgi:hypothetical protein